MSTMTTNEQFKQKLLNEQQSLEEELRAIARFNDETGLWEATPDQELIGEIDDNDAADRFEDFEARSGMVTTLQERLTDIKDALLDIESKKFGICEVCGKQIEADRLDANPSARTCKEHMNG